MTVSGPARGGRMLPSSLRSFAPTVCPGGRNVPPSFPPAGDVLRTVAVSGLRGECFSQQQQRWVTKELSSLLRRLREERGSRILISGMTSGVELWAAEEAVQLGFSLWAYMPFPQQASQWPYELRERWELARGLAACEVYASEQFDSRAYRARDEQMAADCDVLVGVRTDGVGRGAMISTMRSALRAGHVVVDMDAQHRSVRCVDEESLMGRTGTGRVRA